MPMQITVHLMCVQVPVEAKGSNLLELEFTGSCELPDMVLGTESRHCRNNKCS